MNCVGWATCRECARDRACDDRADPKLEELKRALWAADDALMVARTGGFGEQMRMPAVILAVRDAEHAILAHIREQRPKGER